jgi:hypothetical protein
VEAVGADGAGEAVWPCAATTARIDNPKRPNRITRQNERIQEPSRSIAIQRSMGGHGAPFSILLAFLQKSVQPGFKT